MDLTNDINKLIRKISEVKPNENDVEKTIQKLFKKLRENYTELFEIKKKYVSEVRNDIKE